MDSGSTNNYVFGNILSQDSPLFAAFERYGRKISYARGISLFRQGERPTSIFLLLKGGMEKYATSENGEKKILSLHLGSCVLGMECLDNESAVTYRCLLDSVFYAISTQDIRAIDTPMLLELFKYAIFQSILLQAQLRYLTTMDSRANILCILREFDAVCAEQGLSGEVRMTQQMIAQMTGLTRVQVTNILGKRTP